MLPPWYTDALAREGGGYDAVTVREPKRRHGRDEVRLLWALADPVVLRGAGVHGSVGAPWPHLAQVARVERRRTVYRRGQVHPMLEVTYAITSLSPDRVGARTLLGHLRGHWGIESAPRSAEGGHSTKESCQEWAVWLEGQAWGAEATPGLKLPRHCGGGRPSAPVCC